MMRWGGTVATMAAASAGRLALLRQHGWSAELRADRVGAMLSGSPDAMTSVIRKITASLEEVGRKHGGTHMTSPDIETALNKLWQRIKAYYNQEKIFAHLEYADPHPTLNQRSSHLAEFKKTADYKTRVEQAHKGAGLGLV